MRTGYAKYLGSAILLTVLIAALIPPESAEYSSRNDKIMLKLETEHEKYYTGQKLWVKLTLTNNSDSNYLYNMFTVYGIRFSVFDESGKEYRNPGISCGILIPPYDTLKPGASVETTGDLERYFPRHLPESTLSIKTFYNNLESNEVIVKVEDPKGVDKKAQIELNNHFNNSLNSDNWQNADFELWKDIRRYPRSVYASQMYEALILHYIFTPSYIVENVYMKEFMENHCESFNSRLIIVFYAAFLEKRKMMGREGIDERLSYWADLHKGSFAGNLIEEMKPGILKGVK